LKSSSTIVWPSQLITLTSLNMVLIFFWEALVLNSRL